jgi:voltage-gated potassium channel Kch
MGRIGRLLDLRGRWLRLRWGSVAAMALVALALGWAGFDAYLDRTGAAHSQLDSLYRALGLFTLEGGDVGESVPGTLQVARFLAPLSVFAAAVGATMAVLRGEVQRVKAHWFVRGHIVVVGLNARGLRLARQLVATGKRCVIVDVVEVGSRSAGARLLGIPVVTAPELDNDLVDPAQLLDLLARSGLRRADAAVVMTESPALNARFAYVLHTLLDEEQAPRRVFVEMDDVDNLRSATGHSSRATRGNLEWFSLADRAARSLLEKIDLLLAVRTRPARHHLVVVGRTPVARSLIVQAARNWSRDLGRLAEDPAIPSPVGHDHDRLVLTLVAPSTSTGRDEVSLDHEPHLLHQRDPRVPQGRSELAELIVTRWDVARGGLGQVLATPPSVVIVTADSDDELLRLSLEVTSTLPRAVPVWLCAAQSGGLIDIVSGRDAQSVVRPVNLFHAVDTVLREDGILRGVDEELARAVHQAHRRYRNAATTSPLDLESTIPWDELSPALRALNQQAVSAWRRVLVEDGGFRFVPYGQLGAEAVVLHDDLVERTAIVIHRAWNAEKKHQGYRQGVRKNSDPELGPLTHPDIDVPFAGLPPESRRWNLLQARLIPEHLAAAGLQLDPLPPSPAPATDGPTAEEQSTP